MRMHRWVKFGDELHRASYTGYVVAIVTGPQNGLWRVERSAQWMATLFTTKRAAKLWVQARWPK